MNNVSANALEDIQVAKLKEARSSSAVLKLRLVTLRGRIPQTPIFVFEGMEDKNIYSKWIRRIKEDVIYEPFPCSGKNEVFQLMDMVQRDLNNLRDKIFFFVDRDFDDLRGRAPSGALFMTDKYSIENYLVSEIVLDSILQNELHCHGEPGLRERIKLEFIKLYDDFLGITRQINFRIFLARRLQMEMMRHLPDRINELATVELTSISASDGLPEKLVVWNACPTPLALAELEAEFASLNPRDRYRGKFALLFFKKWLEQLSTERNNPTSAYFEGVVSNNRIRRDELVSGNFASNSTIPAGLRDFIMAV